MVVRVQMGMDGEKEGGRQTDRTNKKRREGFQGGRQGGSYTLFVKDGIGLVVDGELDMYVHTNPFRGSLR